MRRLLALLAVLIGVEARAADPILAVGGEGDLGLVAGLAMVDLGRGPSDIVARQIDHEFVYELGRDGRLAKRRLRGPGGETSARLPGRPVDFVLAADGRSLLAALDDPPRLVVLDTGALSELHVRPIAIEGGATSPPASLHTLSGRGSFLIALRDIAELWEIPYGDNPAYRGWVHDFRNDGPPEAVPRFSLRRIPLKEPLAGLAPPANDEFVALTVPGERGIQFMDLYLGRVFSTVSTEAGLRLDRALRVEAGLVVPFDDRPQLELFDMIGGTRQGTIALSVPARHLARGPDGKLVFVASGHRIDMVDIAAKVVRHSGLVSAGRIAALAWDGARLLAAIAEADEILVLDPLTLKIIERLPMRRPVGLYDPKNRPGIATGAAK